MVEKGIEQWRMVEGGGEMDEGGGERERRTQGYSRTANEQR